MEKLNTSARTTEVDAVSDGIVNLFDAQPVKGDTWLENTVGNIRTTSADITTAIKKNDVLVARDDADAERDNRLRDLWHIINGYTHFPMSDIAEKAKKVQKILDKYKLTIVSLGYNSESSYIESLLEDLAADDINLAVSSLAGVPECVKNIRSAQDRFVERQLTYQQAAAQTTDMKTASQVKAELLQLINSTLVPYLNVMKGVNPQMYSGFANGVEKIIDDQNAVVNSRSTRAANRNAAKDNADVETPEQPDDNKPSEPLAE